MKSWVSSVSTAYDKLVGWLGLLPGLFVAVVAFSTCLDVLLRNLGFGGISGSIEIIEYSLLTLTFVGIGYAMRVRRHITVDILSESLPPHIARWVVLAALALATIFSFIFLVFGILRLIHAISDGGYVQGIFFIPEWYLISVLPFGFFFLTIELIRAFVLALRDTRYVSTEGVARDGGL